MTSAVLTRERMRNVWTGSLGPALHTADTRRRRWCQCSHDQIHVKCPASYDGHTVPTFRGACNGAE